MVIDPPTAGAIFLMILVLLTGIIGWLIVREVGRNDEDRKEFRERLENLEKSKPPEAPETVKFPNQGGA